MELLAPAGNIDSFWAAAECGADAVYVGLKKWNARSYAKNFSIDECGHLIEWARKRKIKVYIALNSLLRAREQDELAVTLQELSDITPDALIVQDLGILYAAKQFIPEIPIHISTLAGVHNLEGVKAFAKQGAKRVVLARELNIDQISTIAEKASIETEVFIHGALCFSYSGFCMASSFRGGRSGLEGKCAQPCRLKFRQGRSEGFFLSCNDFSGIRFVPLLKKTKVKAIKIEGRMKPADYVAKVVKAYRMVLDSKTPSEEKEKIELAEEILSAVPSRKLSYGYFSENPSKDILSPYRSGTSGKLVGTIKKKLDKGKFLIAVHSEIEIGDMIRPESSRQKEEPIFKIKKMYSTGGETISHAFSGNTICLKNVPDLPIGTRLFKIGKSSPNYGKIWKEIKKESKFKKVPKNSNDIPSIGELLSDKRPFLKKIGKTLILKVGNIKELFAALNSPAKWVILKATMANLKELANVRLIKAQKKRIVLSLPSPSPVEQDWETPVKWFISKGFLLWEANNLAHFEILPTSENIGIIGGPKLNVKNSCSMEFLNQLGCKWLTLSPEISASELKELSKGPLPAIPIITVFHWMPLMTSALKPKLMEKRVFRSPKGDGYYYKQAGPYSFIFADRPVSWFEKIPELEKMGYRLFEIDISEAPKDLYKDIPRLLSGYKRLRSDEPYSVFNWEK